MYQVSHSPHLHRIASHAPYFLIHRHITVCDGGCLIILDIISGVSVAHLSSQSLVVTPLYSPLYPGNRRRNSCVFVRQTIPSCTNYLSFGLSYSFFLASDHTHTPRVSSLALHPQIPFLLHLVTPPPTVALDMYILKVQGRTTTRSLTNIQKSLHEHVPFCSNFF